MFENYDLYTIYKFYDELGKQMQELYSYCFDKYNGDMYLIDRIADISREYIRIVVKEFESTYL